MAAVNTLDLVSLPFSPFSNTCRVPARLGPITRRGEEVRPRDVGATRGAVQEVWEAAKDVYRTGLHPALQLCIRRDGGVVLHRCLGHASGNAPEDPPGTPKRRLELDTPFCLYSASKAVTAMVIHKLDEEGVLHLDDRICDYLPEFGSGPHRWITIRHVLGHRAGIPHFPPDTLSLDLLEDPDRIIALLSQAEPVARPGLRLAYHAVTGGFVLAAVVQRATGQDIRSVLTKQLCEPLGFHWMNYGVAPEDVNEVVHDAVTGLPVHKLLPGLAQKALGANYENIMEMASHPRFLTGIVPSANVVSSADELSAWYQCMLDGGELDGVRVYDPRTVRHARVEQAYFEIDLTLVLPLRHSLGFMLGADNLSPYGSGTHNAFGHIGMTNIFSWADPDRRLAVALLTSGKPTVTPEAVRVFQLVRRISERFPPL
jgi:CubicO group peptidase (beta-lactamase class C family)